jgi:hypothetical protein
MLINYFINSLSYTVKVKLTLCFFLNWAPHHEGVLEWRYSSTHSLTSELDGGEWSASRPGRFTPRERSLGTHWIGGWVGSRAVLDAVVKRKIPSPSRESNPRTPIVQPYPSAIPTELSRPLIYIMYFTNLFMCLLRRIFVWVLRWEGGT